jgi:hypothetical protein
MAVVFKSKQSGVVTLTAASTSVNVAITSVDTAKSFLKYTWSGAGDRDSKHLLIYGYMNTATQLVFGKEEAGGTPQDVTIQWQVMEYTSGVTVQRGAATTWTANTDKDVTITAVDTTKSFLILNVTGSWNYGVDGSSLITAALTSTTNLRLRQYRTNALSSMICYWQVVQYDDCTVAFYEKTATGTSDTISITSVNTAKSMLIVTYGTEDDFSYSEDMHWITYFSNATTIQLTRKTDDAVNNYFKMYVVTFTDSTVVTRGTIAFGTGDTSKTAAISVSDTSKTFINGTGSTYGTNALTTGSTGAIPSILISVALTNSTTITGARYQTDTLAVTFYFEIIEYISSISILYNRGILRGVGFGIMRGVC